ncbi:hypothetical protein C1645_825621 [Glomus cerebriforme]|uniref:Uncharacterized protein n=1 Tax=Glomus cerebriforme TaxID=658196 RepID=A0A397ST55_9GLOM|nr:hypothetical protein C1645_825621 [Glomus cerebriforme]
MRSLKDNVYNENFNEYRKYRKYRKYLGKLKDNTKDLVNIIEQQRAVSNDLFVIAKIDSNVWNKTQSTIYTKVEFEMANYSALEKIHISELEIAINKVDVTLEEYGILMLMKYKSNSEFHGDRFQTRTEEKKS